MPQIGELDERITLQTKTEVTDTSGDRTHTWADTWTDWAKVVHARGNEKFEAARLTEVADIEIFIRYRGNISRDNDRFVYKSNTYDIYSIQTIGRMRWERVLAKLIPPT